MDDASTADLLKLLNQKIVQLHAQGSLAEAMELAEEAVPISREVHGPRDPEVATSLTTLAVLHDAMGNPTAARSSVQEALEIRREVLGPRHPDVAKSLYDLAVIHEGMRDLANAERLAEEALAIRREALGEGHPDIARTLEFLAGLSQARGEFGAAKPLLEEALDIYRAAPDDLREDVATVLNNLGVVHVEAANYASAEPLYREALALWRDLHGERHPSVASTLNNVASLLRHMGDFTAAEPLAREALEILRESPQSRDEDVAHALIGLAGHHQYRRRHEDAGGMLEEALEILRGVLGPRHPDVGLALNELALLHRVKGDHDSALPLAKEALEIRREALGPRNPAVAASLDNLALLYQEIGEFETAEPLIREALVIYRETLGHRHPEVATNLLNLSWMCAATDRDAEALESMDEASRIHDGVLGDVFSVGSERQRTIFALTLQTYVDAYVSLVCDRFPAEPGAIGKAMDLVLRRKAVGTEALAAQRDAVLGRGDPKISSALEELREIRMRIARKTLSGPGPEGIDEHQRQLSEWTEAKEQVERDLAEAIPEIRVGRQLREADGQAVAEALPVGSVLVEFARFSQCDFRAIRARGDPQWNPARYVAFILPAGDPDAVGMVDLGAAGPIDELIARYRDAVTGQGKGRQARGEESEPVARGVAERKAGGALRAAVFDPLIPHLMGRTRMLLAPSGDLTSLPFEVLPTDDGGRLIDEYVLSYLSAGRDALRFQVPAGSEPEPPLVAAAPDFDLGGVPSGGARPGRRSMDLSPSRIHFDPLGGTAQEGRAIGKLVGASPWVGGAVLEARVKASRSPRILHLATHGFFLPDQGHDPDDEVVMPPHTAAGMGPLRGAGMENPLLRSGLALAGANTFLDGGSPPADAEDGILTAEDVSGLDLLGTELAVLSACETGLGEVYPGEGVFGLRRAFVLAGARTLVMSLWKVPDGPSAELMQSFYENLGKGMGRAEALRAAQLALAFIYPPPWFWGAFVCQGDPGPLPRSLEGS